MAQKSNEGSIWGKRPTRFFIDLGAETILESVERLGLATTGRVLALNALENRVYEIELESPLHDGPHGQFIIAKFYRPGRWTKEQILEEHQFLQDLEQAELSVCAPLKINGTTLAELESIEIYYSLFPKKGGRLKDELSDTQVEILGRLLARMHTVGKEKKSPNRITLNETSLGLNNLQFLLQSDTFPVSFKEQYQELVLRLVELSRPLFKEFPIQRIHGDFHWGNVLWRDEEPLIVDFDDMAMGPVAQDLWPIIPGSDPDSLRQRSILLEAYESMTPFDWRQTQLMAPLQALRSVNYAAWIAKRFEDPSFKQTFTWFGTEGYWSEQIHFLAHQIYNIEEKLKSEF